MGNNGSRQTYMGYRWALITGASSGIGEAFARELSRRGLHQVLVARSEEKLQRLSGEIEKEGVMTHPVVLDLTEKDASEKVALWCEKEGIEPDLLVNSAGFGLFGAFERYTASEYAEMVELNLRSLTELCARFLPSMLERGRGGVINVASQAGLVPVPYYAVYAATKAYVVNFSYALWAEFRKRGVRVTCLAPGPTRTAFQKRAGSKPHGYMQKPNEVVLPALRALERNRPLVVTGSGRWATSRFPLRLLPSTMVVSYVARMFKPEK